MTTKKSKDKPGKKPLKTDKKASSMPSVADRKRTQDKFLALAKERGYKKGRLGGAIIHIPEGTDIM